MAATFTIDLVTAAFRATMRGSRQEIAELQTLTVTVTLDDSEEWLTLQSMVTPKYHVHSPLGNDPIIDIVRGAGEGLLTIDGLGETTALLVQLERSTYLPHDISQGTARFLVTGDPL